jgi:hypothetical protein
MGCFLFSEEASNIGSLLSGIAAILITLSGGIGLMKFV